MKVLHGVNLEQSGMVRQFPNNMQYLQSVIRNIRRDFHNAGYDVSLLTDADILATQDLIDDEVPIGEIADMM